jgi:hypothetical protein
MERIPPGQKDPFLNISWKFLLPSIYFKDKAGINCCLFFIRFLELRTCYNHSHSSGYISYSRYSNTFFFVFFTTKYSTLLFSVHQVQQKKYIFIKLNFLLSRVKQKVNIKTKIKCYIIAISYPIALQCYCIASNIR